MIDFCTNNLYWNIALFVIGVVVLIKASDIFVEAASLIARRSGVSELVIGLTLVSIGTSLPELATNIIACLQKQSEIAMGNIVGSNITNILLILGFGVTLLGKVEVPKNLFYRDGTFLILSTLALCIPCWLGYPVNRAVGMIFFLILAVYIVVLCRTAREDVVEEGGEGKEHATGSVGMALLWLVFSLIGIFAGAKAMVDTVVWTAERLNISASVIALTVVALGTSLPELAVTIAGIIKKRNGIALGNIVGSCIMNILLILGFSAVIYPLSVDRSMLVFHMPLLLVTSCVLCLLMRTRWRLGRLEGGILFLEYVGFMIYNFYHI